MEPRLNPVDFPYRLDARMVAIEEHRLSTVIERGGEWMSVGGGHDAFK